MQLLHFSPTFRCFLSDLNSFQPKDNSFFLSLGCFSPEKLKVGRKRWKFGPWRKFLLEPKWNGPEKRGSVSEQNCSTLPDQRLALLPMEFLFKYDICLPPLPTSLSLFSLCMSLASCSSIRLSEVLKVILERREQAGKSLYSNSVPLNQSSFIGWPRPD